MFVKKISNKHYLLNQQNGTYCFTFLIVYVKYDICLPQCQRSEYAFKKQLNGTFSLANFCFKCSDKLTAWKTMFNHSWQIDAVDGSVM